LGEVKVASAANGTALTTTAAFISLFPGTNLLRITPRNAVTAVVVRYALNPWLTVLRTADALVTVASLLDASRNLQDNDTATVLNLDSFDTVTNNRFIYIGSHIQFRGVRVIIGNTNSNASVLTVKYWNGSAWVTISATDNTAAAGATFAATANVTWNVPSAWAVTSLNAAGDTLLRAPAELMDPQLYWTRWEVNGIFDASVTVTGMQAMNRVTTYDELDIALGDAMRVFVGPKGTGCIEALTDAGTASLIVRCATVGIGSRFI